jgi:ABC-2 type transport system permease protein
MTKLFRDTLLLLGTHLRLTLRNPIWVFFGLFQPICYLLLFAPLLTNLTGRPGFPSGSAYNVFTPGILIVTALYGTLFGGFGLIASLRAGVVERWRVTPVNRAALVLGLVMRDVVILLVQSVLLVVFALLLGFRPDALGMGLIVLVMVLIGLMCAACSYALALTMKDENALSSTLNFFGLPLLLLSGIMLPLTLAPAIIRTIARANPFAYAVDAARALVNGQLGDSSVMTALIVLGLLTALALFWAVRAMRRATL